MLTSPTLVRELDQIPAPPYASAGVFSAVRHHLQAWPNDYSVAVHWSATHLGPSIARQRQFRPLMSEGAVRGDFYSRSNAVSAAENHLARGSHSWCHITQQSLSDFSCGSLVGRHDVITNALVQDCCANQAHIQKKAKWPAAICSAGKSVVASRQSLANARQHIYWRTSSARRRMIPDVLGPIMKFHCRPWTSLIGRQQAYF